jgi:hypothetical protein
MKKAAFSLLMLAGFAASAQEKTDQPALGNNIITAAPVHIIGEDFGVNLAYERILMDGYMGIKVPVVFSINNPYFYVAPTFKFYPARQGVVRYHIGPQIYMGIGEHNRNYSYYNPQGNYVTTKGTYSDTRFGFMVNNGVNATIAGKVYMGIDLAAGVNYYSEFARNANGTYQNYNGMDLWDNDEISVIGQFSFSIGYRF